MIGKKNQINIGDSCENNAQFRPDVVWFREAPNIILAKELCKDVDILVIVGTSLTAYLAANIVDFTPT